MCVSELDGVLQLFFEAASISPKADEFSFTSCKIWTADMYKKVPAEKRIKNPISNGLFASLTKKPGWRNGYEISAPVGAADANRTRVFLIDDAPSPVLFK